MGAVHGVYLKYVGLSVLSYAGYALLMSGADAAVIAEDATMLAAMASLPFSTAISAAIMGYSALINGAIAIMFKLKRGMSVIGKNDKNGTIPLWSYIVFFPFHLPSILYTHIHTRMGTTTTKTPNGQVQKTVVPVASEVQPGWWIGGCYSHELNKQWAGIIDQTVEFPESCIGQTKEYYLLPTWDGVPATPEQLEDAATFAVAARQNGDVLVHCAHGRGRSTTVMCACLVKDGLFPTWQEAFEKGVKPQRSVCKLNAAMRRNLSEWQAIYVDGKKAQ